MIEERMKSAMQNKLPDVPEGFDARSDMQLLELTTPVKEKRMKLSIGWVTALVLVCVLATGAVAATLNLFGLGDFISRHAGKTGATVTEQFKESIQTEDITVETDRAVYTVQESYYDGSSIWTIMTIQPRENVMLVDGLCEESGYDADGEPWTVYDNIEPTTIAEYVGKNCDGRLAGLNAEINLWPDAAKMDELPVSAWTLGNRLNEDGSVTMCYQYDVGDQINEREERDILLVMSYTPGTVSAEEHRIDLDKANTETTEIPLKIRFAGNEQYACNQKLEFPDAGVTVENVFMTVTPLEINCAVSYRITDSLKWYKARTDEAGLMFRFVKPDSASPDGWEAVPAGFSGGYTETRRDGPFRATFAISREAFSGHYALQAYNRTLGMVFNTVEFDVEPWEEEVLYTPHEPAEWLYEYQPEKPSKLTEENRSCGKDGFRLELVSSSVEDGMLNMVFSLEDTEGNRISETTEADITLDGEPVEQRYDAEQKKLFLTWTTAYEATEDAYYELEIAWLRNKQEIEVDLLPLLKEYGSRAELVSIREEDFGGNRPGLKNVKVLDYTNSLEIPLSKHVMLSGIGIEDGTLRVQFHYPKHHQEAIRIFKDAQSRTYEWSVGPYKTITYSPYECVACLYEAEERHEELPLAEDIEYPARTGWGRADGNEESEARTFGASLNMYEWEEFSFGIGSGLAETQKLTAGIHEEEPPVIGLWAINVSTDLVPVP